MTKIKEKKQIKEIVEKTNLQHIAIIMDGNRRWAKTHLLPSAVGHQKGVESLKKTMRAFDKFGIKYLTVYAFSTENWNRKKEEVDFLMNLLAKTLTDELEEMHNENVKIRFIGNIGKLSPKLVKILKNAEKKTEKNTGVNLQIAFNYGARDEIVQAAKKIAQKAVSGEIKIDNIDETMFSENLYTADMPDPDLLIRTGGEKRISNYLLWQIAYSEVYVTDKFWPEFDEKALSEAVTEFEKRNRRYGK